MQLNDKNYKKLKKMYFVVNHVKFKNVKKEQERLNALRTCDDFFKKYEEMRSNNVVS